MKYLITMYVVNPHASEDGVQILPESATTLEWPDDSTIYKLCSRFLKTRPEYWSISVLKQGDHEYEWNAVAYILNSTYDPAEQARKLKCSIK